MKRFFSILLCLSLLLSICSCEKEHSLSEHDASQTVSERFDPQNVLTPDTFELKEHQVRNNNQNQSHQHVYDITYYGYDGQLTYKVSSQPNNPYVISASYFINTESESLLLDTFPQILEDAYSYFETAPTITVSNTPVDSISLEEIFSLNGSESSAYVMWEWNDGNFRTQMRLMIFPLSKQKYSISIEYRDTHNF